MDKTPRKLNENYKEHHPITVVCASAGSGKTRQISKRFLKLLFSHSDNIHYFKKINAITFTKKAAKEMKERIFKYLIDIYHGREKEILKDLHTPEDSGKLKNFVRELLKNIIDNYSELQISTIDSFIRRISNSSASYLNLPPNLEILMEVEGPAESVIESYISEANREKLERIKLMIKNVLSNGIMNTGFNPIGKLKNELVKLIEERLKIFKGATDKTIPSENRAKDAFERIKKSAEVLYQATKDDKNVKSHARKAIENIYIKLSRNPFEFISSLNLGKTLANAESFNDLLNKKAKGKYNGEYEIHYKNLKEGLSDLIKAYLAMKIEVFSSLADEIFLLLIKNIRKNHSVFLNELYKILVEKVKIEEFPDLYFYLGEKIKHYLIDEFQDTSPTQWAVIEPLSKNSISEGGSLFVVGDEKQAIYGWRGGSAKILEELAKEGKKYSREYNYRSLPQIVNFNNKIFSSANLLENLKKHSGNNSNIVEHFKDSTQKVKRLKEGEGYVCVIDPQIYLNKNDENKLNKDDLRDLVRETLLNKEKGILTNLLKKRNLKDLAILVRDNNDMEFISTLLIEADIPIISAKTLDIRSNNHIKELISFLYFLNSPTDDLSFASFLAGDIFSFESGKKREEMIEFIRTSKNFSRSALLYKEFRKNFKDLWETHFKKFFSEIGFKTPYDIVWEFVIHFKGFFKKNPEVLPYFLKFLDVLKTLEEESKNTLVDVLDSVENGSDEKFQIFIPESAEGVMVTTIHKAKGLKFPVVILPFAFIKKPNAPKILYSDDGVLYHAGDQNMRNYCKPLLELYENKKIEELREEINLLYVASTRAEEELYIISPAENKNNYVHITYPFTEEIRKKLKNKGFLEFGSPLGKIKKENKEHNDAEEYGIPDKYYDWTKNIIYLKPEEIILDEKVKEKADLGTLVHSALYYLPPISKDVDFEKILDESLSKACGENNLWQYKEKAKEILLRGFQNKNIRDLLSEHNFIPEMEIIDKNAATHRIDRVIFRKEEIIILEFKSGEEKNDKHLNQVKNYKSLLKEIYPEKRLKTYLIYLDQGLVEEVK